MTSLSKHFIATDELIATGYVGVLGHKDYGGLLETCMYYRLGLGEDENISEDICQLVSVCSNYMSW
jgi:hypothetical protein